MAKPEPTTALEQRFGKTLPDWVLELQGGKSGKAYNDSVLKNQLKDANDSIDKLKAEIACIIEATGITKKQLAEAKKKLN